MTSEQLELVPVDGGEEQAETTRENVVLQVIPDPSDPTQKQYLRLVELSGALDFWDNPAEDVYSLEDGEAL
ncbi:MAG: hypothetical protein JXQ75_05695 [Phycisphaerae bacterium]|nr:hypothetical protein [Phycisphaerae bacterium]